PIYARHVTREEERGARTEQIDPLVFEDYRMAEIGEDKLHYGTGLFTWYRAPNDTIARGSERRDYYSRVTAERSALIRHCGNGMGSRADFLTPIPAILDGVGIPMGMEEAISLLAFGRPAYDFGVWLD